MFELFIEFAIKLFPIYLWALFGFILGKLLKVRKNDAANILVFLILPLITFHGSFTTPVTVQALSLPLFFFLLCSIITLLFLWLGKKTWKDNTGNLLAFASSYGNYGYFALPAAIVLFGKDAESSVIMAGIGFIIYSCTVGYFVTALGNFTIAESLKKTLVLPSVYAMILGLSLNVLNIKFGSFRNIDLNDIYLSVARDVRGVYTIIGMMLVGLAIAEIKTLMIDWKFVGMASLAQFVIWPIVVGLYIILDKNILHFYPVLLLKIIFLLSLIPVGVNLIAYSSQLGVHPEKAAVAILLTTIFAMLFIPFMISVFIGFI
jgi:hypothetical protein